MKKYLSNTRTQIVALASAAIFSFGLVQSSTAAVIGQLGVFDGTANGGINPNTGVVWAAGDTYRLVFVTSTTIDATSSSVATYDAFVQGVANTAGLGTGWSAIVGTSNADGTVTTAARDNTGLFADTSTTTAIINFNNTVVRNNYGNFFAYPLLAAIEYDESGVSMGGDRVWTGSNQNGTTNITNGYGLGIDLTLTTFNPTFGIANSTTTAAIRAGGVASSTSYSLYGISDVLTVQAVPEPSSLALLGLSSLALLRRRR